MRSPRGKSGEGILPGCLVPLGMSVFQVSSPSPSVAARKPAAPARCVGFHPRMKVEMWVAERSAAHEGRKGAWRSERCARCATQFRKAGQSRGRGV